MKWVWAIGFVVLVSLVSRVSSADLGHAGNEEGGFQEDDNDLIEKAYRVLLDKGLDEEALGDVLAASWFSKAVKSVGHWGKQAVKDVGHAASNAGQYLKKGCHYVNQVPFKEFVQREREALRTRGVSEEQLVSGAYGAYQGAKALCHAVG